MKPTIVLGVIAGIKIGIHYSLFLAMALVTWSLSNGFLPEQYRDWDTLTYWLTGFISAAMLFVSVLIHELAHSIVAKIKGFEVDGIILFLLGGVTNLNSSVNKAGSELVIASVGPLVSFGLSAIFRLTFEILPTEENSIAAVIVYLALINFLLGSFNLLPAFPLDGGRVLKSLVWTMTGSLARANNVANVVGRIFGIVMIGLGLILVFSGSIVGGIWIVLMGWFLQKTSDDSQW